MTKLRPRERKVKILATVGPASRDPDMLRLLVRAGVDAFRLNMSHGEHADHGKAIKAIRSLEKELGRPIAILADLQGPKLRVGVFKDGEARIPHGARFTLDRSDAPGDATRVQLPHPELFGLLSQGQRLLINDGKIRLRVESATPQTIVTKAEIGGVIEAFGEETVEHAIGAEPGPRGAARLFDELVAQHDLDLERPGERDIGGAEFGQDEIVVLDHAEELGPMRIIGREALVDIARGEKLGGVGSVADARIAELFDHKASRLAGIVVIDIADPVRPGLVDHRAQRAGQGLGALIGWRADMNEAGLEFGHGS